MHSENMKINGHVGGGTDRNREDDAKLDVKKTGFHCKNWIYLT
jgi:hypothetical protein